MIIIIMIKINDSKVNDYVILTNYFIFISLIYPTANVLCPSEFFYIGTQAQMITQTNKQNEKQNKTKTKTKENRKQNTNKNEIQTKNKTKKPNQTKPKQTKQNKTLPKPNNALYLA